jgi:hypothetical protein
MASISAVQMGAGSQLQCNGCRATLFVTNQHQEVQFRYAHARCPELLPVSETHYGLGDIIAAVANPIARFFRRDPHCAPCEERKQWANEAMPRVWRRR